MKSKRYNTSSLHTTKSQPSQLADLWELEQDELAHLADGQRRRWTDRDLRRQLPQEWRRRRAA